MGGEGLVAGGMLDLEVLVAPLHGLRGSIFAAHDVL
jgi:hypothetical protein